MKRYIRTFVSAVVVMLCASSCMKEEVVNNFREFGELGVGNSTPYNTLHLEVDGVALQAQDNLFFKMTPGMKQVQIYGRGAGPADTLVPVFDTLLQVDAGQKYRFSLLQPSFNDEPQVIVNDQDQEPAPASGKVKIRIANFARQCLPDVVDVEMIMNDYNFDNIFVDTIVQAGRSFGSFGTFNVMDRSIAAAGSIFFRPLHPVTGEPLTDFLYGVELDNYAEGTWYNVVTLYIMETPNINGSVVGADGNLYELSVKPIFIK